MHDKPASAGPLLDRGEDTQAAQGPQGVPTERALPAGDERILPIDEYAAEYDRKLRAFARGIRRDMDERTSWTGVTAQTLIDR